MWKEGHVWLANSKFINKKLTEGSAFVNCLPLNLVIEPNFASFSSQPSLFSSVVLWHKRDLGNMLRFTHPNFWNCQCAYHNFKCHSGVVHLIFIFSVMLVKPFLKIKIYLSNLVYSSDRIIFPVALQDGIWNFWISTLVRFLLFWEKHIVKSCHPWIQIQPLISMVPITALHRKVPLFSIHTIKSIH